MNAEELASLQPDLERFFTPTVEGWVPREDVLTSHVQHAGAALHEGGLPGSRAS